jgi:endonuclease/exonuclease/phosphatase (EEP) superfamily protein YafD
MLTLSGLAAALLVIATTLPHVPVAHGIVRVGDFPRQQFLALSLAMLAFSLYWGDSEPAWRLMQFAFAAVVLAQAWFIIRFTPVGRKQSKRFDPACDQGQPVRLVAANIKMSNRRYERFESMVAEADPDLLVVMEVDSAWVDAIEGTLRRFKTCVKQPQENSYGMLLASKFDLEDISVQCLLTEGVPSIMATVALPNGQRFRLYCIHPEPPVPNAGSEGRDGETGLAALKARDEKLPVIVTGDLNDVAWSGTTERFRRISRLLDPRIGRRLFNTFDARFPFMRWPLDHLFHSAHFRLVAMDRLDPGGSDHFPVMFELVLCPDKDAESMPDGAGAGEEVRAKELIGQAARRQEPPIGADWET